MKHNFGAGPCILPQEVFKEASEAVLDLDGIGLSILEISHRSAEFQRIMDEATSLVRELLEVPSDYSILFLHGGASFQFAMVPLNLLTEGKIAAYLDTGAWSKKAIKEALNIGEVEVVASSGDENYSYIPKEYIVSSDAAYFHYTSNNTIYGTEVFDIPKLDVPVVSDMSSDIFSRTIDFTKHDLVYAGAQKNMGPAGVGLVIIKDSLLGKVNRVLPNIFNYSNHINANSLYHTPPVYSIYVSMLNLRWLKAKGGVEVIEQENVVKARTLYEAIDNSKLFKGTAALEDRSRMNITFVMDTPELEAAFLKFATERNIVGIKGHRSVGGFRASIYNGLSISSVNALIDVMGEFEEQIV